MSELINNSEHRRALLKHMIQQLHEGEQRLLSYGKPSEGEKT